MSSFVFISYQRSDDPHAVGRLRDELNDLLGHGSAFMDETEIRAGRAWQAQIEECLGECEIVILVMGSRWDLARLADPADDVRLEIEQALRQSKVILPVFAGSGRPPDAAAMPPSIQSVLGVQGLPLRAGRDFERDLADIVEYVREISPATLAIDVKRPGFMLGNAELRLDGQLLRRFRMREGATISETRTAVGAHLIEMLYTSGGIGRPQRLQIEAQVGANELRLAYSRASATWTAEMNVRPR